MQSLSQEREYSLLRQPRDYQICGLRLRLAMKLSGLMEVKRATVDDETLLPIALNAQNPHSFAPPDSTCWTGGVVDGDGENMALHDSTAPGDSGFYRRLRYTDGRDWAEFQVAPRAAALSVTWSENAPLQEMAALLLGSVLSRVLRERGVLTLHANAIALRGENGAASTRGAILLVGNRRTGKSTTTTALLQAGHRLLAEDLVAPRENGDEIVVAPGSWRVRLWLDAAQALHLGDDLPSVWSARERRIDKRYFPVPPAFVAREAAPLRAIYLLEPRDAARREIEIEPLAPLPATMRLLTHRGAEETVGAAMQGREFTQLCRLCARVPVRRVLRPDDLESLPQLCRALETDALAAAGGAL